MNIDKIMDDIHQLLPSTCEMDDLSWNNEETMMKTRVYKVNMSKIPKPFDPNRYIEAVSPISSETKRRIKAYLQNNALEYEFGTDWEGYPTLRIWEEADMMEDIRKKRKDTAGFFSTLFPGDPEKDAERFNNSVKDCETPEVSDSGSSPSVSESFSDTNWMYISDVIEGMMGNMDDDDIDKDLRVFKRIAQKLQVRNMDDVVVVIDSDSEYDPQYYITDVGQRVGPVYKNSDDLIEYELFGSHLIAENHPNGLFLYFRDSTSAKKYIEAVEKLNESFSNHRSLTESSDRNALIDKIKSFGKNYDFNKYTDQQLFRIVNRLKDKAEIDDVMKEFAEKRKQNEQRKYDSEYDIPDETYVEEALTVRDKLGRLDEQCLDNGRYLDLRNLFEAVSPTMTPEEKEELRKVVNATNDPDIISAYLNGKYKEKDESLQEDLESNLFRRLRTSVADFIEFCRDMEWDFPSGLIFDSWQDWLDDVQMSLAEESVESADILFNLFKDFYRMNRGGTSEGPEDWETDTFLELYDNMRLAYDAAIEEWEKNHAGE